MYLSLKLTIHVVKLWRSTSYLEVLVTSLMVCLSEIQLLGRNAFLHTRIERLILDKLDRAEVRHLACVTAGQVAILECVHVNTVVIFVEGATISCLELL